MNDPIQFTIDGREVEVPAGATALDGARRAGIDIPTLCFNEKCGPLTSCEVCLVAVVDNGRRRLAPACGLRASPGMVIESETAEVHEARRTALELLFSDHVGDCLSPCQRLCPLLLNIPEMLGLIHSQRFDEARVLIEEALPLPSVLSRLCHHPCEQGCRRGLIDSAAQIRELERFLMETKPKHLAESKAPEAKASGKKVAVIGAGPAGLASAFFLRRRGHEVTVLDRAANAGGALRNLSESELPKACLQQDLAALQNLGVVLKQSIEVGGDFTLSELLLVFDAILLATGSLGPGEAERLGLNAPGSAIEMDPDAHTTSLPRVFAAGAVAKPFKQIVRAMADGLAASECVHAALRGEKPRPVEKRFSSTMGRPSAAELEKFIRWAPPSNAAPKPDRRRGFADLEASAEAARCLHCECASSGDCLLQQYGHRYGVDPNRYKTERRKFERHEYPGGIVFEPGKCILCGICVKLTELASEPLGLAFVGRGFDLRVAAPFHQGFSDALTRTVDECVAQCPTGALTALI